MLRVALWTLACCIIAALAFLIATIRVVDSQPGAELPPVLRPAAAPPLAVPSAPPGGVAAPTGYTSERPAAPLLVPVAGVDPVALASNWGDERGDGTRTHQGLDIMAPANTPVIAVANGPVEKLFLSQGGGGISLYQRSADGRWIYYYAHLAGYAPGMVEGQYLSGGEILGYVGDTGNAGPGNFHLHFGVALLAPGERWHQGIPVDPYPLLAGSRAGR